MQLACTNCEKLLKPRNEVWLELSNSTGLYHDPDHFPEGDRSQGVFPFGSDCAKNELRKTAKGGMAEPLCVYGDVIGKLATGGLL